MFSDKTAQNQQPLANPAKSAKVMGQGSTNANIDKKGTFKGASKKTTNNVTKKQGAPMPGNGKFGKAKKIASGKFNHSSGAPGHEPGTI